MSRRCGQAEANTPVGVDPSRASIARMSDYTLGGTDNYQVDRDELKRLRRVMPDVADLALQNRRYLIQVCRSLELTPSKSSAEGSLWRPLRRRTGQQG